MAGKRITGDTLVECKNGTMGALIYVSNRNLGYTVEWSEFGEVQEIEFSELQAMRGAQRRFFEDNWILIEDADVLKKLGVERFYKNALTTENFDSVFEMDAQQIKEKVSVMSDGMKDAVRVRAKEKIASGELDSRSVIKALGEAVGVDLEEVL